MTTIASTGADHQALALLLYASPLLQSQDASPTAVRTAIRQQFRSCRGNLSACLEVVAQEAGDWPDLYTSRMHWAWDSVRATFPQPQTP